MPQETRRATAKNLQLIRHKVYIKYVIAKFIIMAKLSKNFNNCYLEHFPSLSKVDHVPEIFKKIVFQQLDILQKTNSCKVCNSCIH